MANRFVRSLATLFLFSALGLGADKVYYHSHKPELYQKNYPSLSAQDAEKLRKEQAGMYGGIPFGFGIYYAVSELFRKKKQPPQP